MLLILFLGDEIVLARRIGRGGHVEIETQQSLAARRVAASGDGEVPRNEVCDVAVLQVRRSISLRLSLR